MAHFVRCIEGHVFDAVGVTVCPTCGAVVDTTPAVYVALSDGVAAGGATSSLLRAPVLGAAAVLILGLGIAAIFFAWREISPVTGSAPIQTAAKSGRTNPNSAPTSVTQSPMQKDVPASGKAIGMTASAPTAAPVEAPNNPSAAPKIDVSTTLRGTLDVVRMLVAFSLRDYPDAVSRAEPLINGSNPIAMYIKGGILQNGLAGPQDPVQARNLLATGAQLGDPTSALFFARMLEKGIGGSRDLNQAEAYYLFAARGIVADADRDLARLHLDGRRGMNVLEAYQKLVGPDHTEEAMNTMGDLFKAHSTPAVCLYGWLVSQSKSRGWLVTNDTIPVRTTDAKEIDAVRTGQTVPVSSAELDAAQLKYFRDGAVRSDPWCEWGMGMLSAKGLSDWSKNLVEADVFYRLAAMNAKLGTALTQVKQELAAVEGQITPAQKAAADDLFHGAVPTSMAP
jgi:TPR repeat protein